MKVVVPVSIPESWGQRRGKFLFTRVKRVPTVDEGVVTAFRDGQVTLRSKRREDGFTNAELEIGYQGIRTGDLVIHGMDGFAGAIGVSDSDGKASPVVHAYLSLDGNDPRYSAYLLRDLAKNGFITSLAKGIRERSTAFDSEMFKCLDLPMPTAIEQKAIADYLDRETTRIDALIEKKRRLMILVSSRTSQFVGSVCSGTNAADFEHWRRVPLKSLFSFSKGKDAQRLSGEYVGNHQGRYPVYSGQTAGDAVFGQIDTFDFDLPAGAILVATVGAEAMSCRIISGRFSLSQNCALMIPRSGTNVFLPFIVGQLRDLFLEKRSEIPDHMQPSLRIEDLNRFYVQIPSLETQESIASLVDNKWSKTSVLLKSLELQVGKLFERRSSVVSAAVTGELAIPKAAA